MKRMKIFSALVVSALVLSSCGMSEEAKNVRNMIDDLPDSYSAEIEDDYRAAREAYDGLSEEDRESVSAKKLDEIHESKIEGVKTFGITPEEFEEKIKKEMPMFDFQDTIMADKSKDKYEEYQEFVFRGSLGSTGIIFTMYADVLKEKNEITEFSFDFYTNEGDLLSDSEVFDVYAAGLGVASKILSFATGMDDGEGFLIDMMKKVSGKNTDICDEYEDYSVDCTFDYPDFLCMKVGFVE